MNAPFVVAQATSGQEITTGQNPATPPKVVKLVKPQGDQAIVVNMDGNTRLDFSGIAGEKITLVHVGERLVILFDNKSTVTIEPFFDSSGKPLQLGGIDLDGNRIVSGEEFASLFPITEDQSILPAAGDGNAAGPQNTGGQFAGPNIDPLNALDPLDLLPPEALGNWVSEIDTTPLLDEPNNDTSPFQTGATVGGAVEEEHLRIFQVGSPIQLSDGNDDTTSDPEDDDPNTVDGDDDTDTDLDVTTITFTGDASNGQSLSQLIGGGNPPFTFSFNNVTDTEVRDTTGEVVKSQGEVVQFYRVDANTLIGFTDGNNNGFDGAKNDDPNDKFHPDSSFESVDRIIFVVTLDQVEQGAWTIEIYDQFDHVEDGNVENILGLNLTPALHATDVDGDPLDFTGNAFAVGVIDDVPVLTNQTDIRKIDEDDISTYWDGIPGASIGTSPNDGNVPDGSFTGSPGNNFPGPATIFGSLADVVKVGSDEHAPTEGNGSGLVFSFVEGSEQDSALNALNGLGLSSKGVDLVFDISGNELTAMAGSCLVLTLILDADGGYTVKLYDQLDHDQPAFGADQNQDLQDDIAGDVVFLDLGSVIQASDFDHDYVILEDKLLLKITDDIPEIICDREICLTVNEDDIRTDQSEGTSPNDGPYDGSFTGNPFSPFGSGPATVFGSLGGLNGVVQAGADENLTFSFITDGGIAEHLLEQSLGQIGLKSQGDELRFDIQSNVLYAYVGGGGGAGYQDGLGDRLVFQFTLQPNGDFKFELHDQIDHDRPTDDWFPIGTDNVPSGSGADENPDLQDDVPFFDVDSLDFGQLIKATDYDGDSVVLTDQLIIKIKDDIPEAICGAKVTGVVEEEQNPVPGGNEDTTSGPPDLDNDTAGDSDVTTNVVFGTGANSLATLIKVGADENGTFSLKSGVDEGDYLRDKDGNFVKADGQYVKIKDIDPGHDAGGDYTLVKFGTSNGTVATLKIYEDGDWRFELKEQLDHQVDNVEDILVLDLSGLVEFTDFDGDTICLEDCSFQVSVIDDVPLVGDCNIILNGSFELGHNLLDGQWEIFNALPGWEKGDGVPFEVQVGNIGDVNPIFGNAKVELDADTEGNPDITPPGDINPTGNTNATIQQTVTTVAGETYELTFWYAPRPNDGDADSSSMDVLWDGAVVHSIDSSTAASGWQQITLHLTAADASTVLGFRGDGQQNELGAYLDNVSLCRIGVVDEDGLTLPDLSDGIGDGTQIGDVPGNETVATGDLGILWGADNGDANDSGDAASNGTQDGALTTLVGRHVTFSSNAVEVGGIAGPLESKGDAVSFVLSENGTKLQGVAGTGDDYRVVFEAKLLDDGSGSYRFELFDQLDHADGNSENDITLAFDFTATDSDGDQSTGHFKVLVDDDLPVVEGEVCPVVTEGGEAGKIANFVFVLDTSQSVDDQFTLLQQSVNNLLGELGGSGAQDLRVHIVQFSDGASAVGTYDLITGGTFDQAALDEALADVNALNDGGYTNYEAGFQEALLYIQGGDVTLDVTSESAAIDANSGGGNDSTYILRNGGTDIALVSGWQSPGDEIGDLVDAIPAVFSDGLGVGNGFDSAVIDAGEQLRFDFGTFNNFGVANYTNAAGFSGDVNATSATFTLNRISGDGFLGFGAATFQYTIHFVGGTQQSGSTPVSLAEGNKTITLFGTSAFGNDGKEIDYIQFWMSGGTGNVELDSVSYHVDPGTIPDADVNEVIFLSDGEPNRSLDDDGDVISTNAQNSIDQITGTDDSSDEVDETETDGDTPAGPDQAFNINAYGVNANGSGLLILNQIDTDGSAGNITAPDQLSDALQSIIDGLAGGAGGGGSASVPFDLASIVDVGADEDLTFSLKDDVTPLDEQDLASGGVPLDYDVVGNVLTATKGPGGDPVFKLVLNADGTGTFELLGDVDHGDADSLHIDFSAMVLAVDHDNDPAVFGSDAFCVEVVNATDLTPTVIVTGGTVNEAALGAAALDQGSSEITSLLDPNNDPTESVPGTITFTPGDTPAIVWVRDKDGNPVNVTAGDTVQGKYGTLVVSVGGAGVLNWVYTLTDNTLDHDGVNQTGLNDTVVDNFQVFVVDNDGDSTETDGIPASEIISITITDDGPTVTVSGTQQSLDLVNLDETTDIVSLDTYGSGDPALPDNNGESDDTAVTSADPFGVTPFGLATSGVLGGLFNVVKVAGADGEKSESRTLTLQLIAISGLLIDQGVGLQSTLKATQPAPGGNPDSNGVGGDFTPYADNSIYLFREGDGTITGRVGNDEDGPIAFKVSLTGNDPATAQLKVEQFLAIEHPNAPDAFDEQLMLGLFGDTSGGTAAGIALNLSVTITDGDDDTHTDDHAVFITDKIAFDDDGPSVFDAAPAELENSAGATETALLDTDSNIDDNLGSDGGTIVFANVVEGPSGLTSGGQPILLSLVNNDDDPSNDATHPPTLEGRTGDGTLIFSVTLNHNATGNDTYTVTMHGTVDNFTPVNFPASGAAIEAGNFDQVLFANFGAQNLDVLFSSADGTINSNGKGVGIGSQAIGPGHTLDIDFIKNGAYGNGAIDGAAERQTVNGLTFAIVQNNPTGNDGDMLIRAYDANGNEVQITGIFINGVPLVGTAASPDGNNDNIDDNGVASNDGGAVEAAASGLGYNLNGLGGGNNNNAADDDSITVYTANGYSRIEITNSGPDGSGQDSFDLSFESLLVASSDPIPLSFDLALIDGDGDKVVVPDALGITLTPPNVAPVANDDIVLTNISDGSPFTIPNAALLANDTDGDGDPLTVTNLANPSNGTVAAGVVFDPSLAAPVVTVYNFVGVTAATAAAGGHRAAALIAGDSSNTPLINLLVPSSLNNNLNNSGYDAIESLNTTRFESPNPDNGDHSLFLAEFDISQNPAQITEMVFKIVARQNPDDTPDSGEGLEFGIFNYSTNTWEQVTEVLTTSDHTFEVTKTGTAANYVNASGKVALVLYNEFTDSGVEQTIQVNYVELKVTHQPPFVSGAFDYTASDGTVGDPAHVTITTQNGSTITGSGTGQILIGGNDDDTLNGNGGLDVLIGGGGSDAMTGGANKDTYLWRAGDQGSATPGTHLYTFDGVTPGNNVHNAVEFSVNTVTFNNLNALNPSSNTNYVSNSANEATQAQYDALEAIGGTSWTPPEPGGNGNQVMWFQFNIAEAEADITGISINMRAGRPDITDSNDTLNLGIWNHTLNGGAGDWEQLTTVNYSGGTVGDISFTIPSNFANYIDANGDLTVVLFNEDQDNSSNDGQIVVDYVSATISTADGGTPTVVDTINNFQTGIGGDVLNFDNLLDGTITNASPLGTLDDYFQFEKVGSDTVIHVDHDGSGTFQPTMNVVLAGVDLTAGGTFNAQQILQNLLDSSQLQV